MATSVIKNFIAKQIFKKKGVIGNAKSVEFSANALAERLKRLNINPNDIKSEGELNQVLAFVKQAEDQAFTDRFGSMLQGSRFGKSGDVVDMTGKKLDPKKPIMGGTQEESIKKNIAEATKKGDFTGIANQVLRDPDIAREFALSKKFPFSRDKNVRSGADAIPLARKAEFDEEMGIKSMAKDRDYSVEKLVSDFKKFGKATDDDIQTILKSGKSGQIPYVMDNYGMSYTEVLDTLKSGKPLIEGMAQGGRAGYRFGIGPLLELLSKTSPKQAGQKYLKSVKDRTQKGDMKSLAPELGAVAATGIFVNRRMKDVLENMKNQDMENNLENFIKELDADPFYNDYPELKDKMIEGYTEMMFGEKRADGGRIGYKLGLSKRFLELFKTKPKGDKIKGVDGKEIDVADLKKSLGLDETTQKKDIEDLEKKLQMIIGRDRTKHATGGRAGFANGSEGIMSLNEGAPSILLKPRASGIMSEQQIAPGVNLSQRDINYGISGILQGDKFYGGASFDKGKVKFDVETEDGQTLFKDTIAKDDALNFILGMGDPKGEKDKFQIKFDDDLENMSLILKKSFAEGGRANFDNGGMSRRQFMKIMGGLASLPFIGKFFKGAKPAAKVAEVATKSTGGQPPAYFFDLAEKIKILGKESKISPRERVKEIDYKNYTLQEDITTGDMTIVKRKGDPEFAYEEEVMVLRKGQPDEMTKGKTPPDDYEELTVRPDPEGKMKDVEDGIQPSSVKEIMEEVGQGGGNLDQQTLESIARGKLASGGVAMMLGE